MNGNKNEENFPLFDYGFTHSAVASFLDYLYTGQVNLTSEARAKEIHKGKFHFISRSIINWPFSPIIRESTLFMSLIGKSWIFFVKFQYSGG